MNHNALRAWVMGLIDGLVTLVLLIAAGFELKYLVVALVAGSLSMSIAEYVSVANQRDAALNSWGKRSAKTEFNPWHAGLSSLASFALGGFVILLPQLLGSKSAWDYLSYFIAAVFLFGFGGLTSQWTGTSFIKGAARLTIGAALATIISYYLGVLL